MSIETKIDELIAALSANTDALRGDTHVPAADPATPKKTRGKAAAPTEQTPPATTAAPPASAPAATGPASVVASAPAAPDQKLLTQATEVVIKIANEYSRDTAVGILGKKRGAAQERPGVTRCSDLSPFDWQDVLNEATAALAQLEAAKKAATANASLV